MKIKPNEMKSKDERGKCFICGYSTNLPIHQNCSKKKSGKKKVPDIDERICVNLDCNKIYKPTNGKQKLCRERIDSRIERNKNKLKDYY